MPRVTPYTVAVYRRGASGVSTYREQRAEWRPHLSDVACDIQIGRGGVEGEESGRVSRTGGIGFFDTGEDLKPDDGIQVTAGPGLVGQRFVLGPVMDWGAPGDLEVRLEQTLEVFD